MLESKAHAYKAKRLSKTAEEQHRRRTSKHTRFGHSLFRMPMVYLLNACRRSAVMKSPMKIEAGEPDLAKGIWQAKGDLKTKGRIAIHLAWIRVFTVFMRYCGPYLACAVLYIMFKSL